ncbi:hypothetical protein B7R78_0018160 [Ralstonia solanacearum]|nr:hypothetical protein [Ralstonia solanacearum]
MKWPQRLQQRLSPFPLSLKRSPHIPITLRGPDAWVCNASRLVKGAGDIKRQAMLTDEDVAEPCIHQAARMAHRAFQVEALGVCFAAGLEQGGDERIGVADGIIGFLCRQRGGTSTRHEFLRPECAQGFQRGGLLLKKDQGRPGQAGDGFNPGKQAWESLDPGLHVLLAVLDDQVVCSPAGDDLLAALRENAEALSTRTA